MAEERGEISGRRPTQTRKRRRVRPCANHPKAPAVTRCEVCGKPICKKCASSHEDARLCGEACWETMAGRNYKKATAEERSQRRKKEKQADRAVTIGLLAAALTVVGVVAAVILLKMTDHTGEKLWEISGPGYSSAYTADPYSATICFASYDGSVKTINSLTGEVGWTVKLPEGERPSHPRMIDDDTILVRSGYNKLYLCGSSRNVPLWELTAPRPVISGEPVAHDKRVYVASSSGSSFFGGYSQYGYDAMSPADLVARALSSLSGTLEKDTEEDQSKTTSTITAVGMRSGETLWSADLEDIKIAGLLADDDRVYAAGYRPLSYEDYISSDAAAGETEDDEEEDTGTTQLWALNAETGEPEWTYKGTGSLAVPPVMSDEGIAFATRRNVYLVSHMGEPMWKHPQRNVSSIKPNGASLLLSTVDGFLICLDLESGEKKWTVHTGVPAYDIVASDNLVCAPSMVEVNKEPRKVIPTKRWKGSEDLLEKAMKSSGVELEPILVGLDPQTGDTLWTIRNVDGEFEYADGTLYTLRHHTRLLLLDATADPSELFGGHTTLAAYDATTGEQIWQQGIDGRASNLRLAFGVALLTARPDAMSVSADGGGPVSIRLIAISLR